MKNLLICLVTLVALKELGLIDLNCVNNCTAQGNMLMYCNRLCTY